MIAIDEHLLWPAQDSQGISPLPVGPLPCGIGGSRRGMQGTFSYLVRLTIFRWWRRGWWRRARRFRTGCRPPLGGSCPLDPSGSQPRLPRCIDRYILALKQMNNSFGIPKRIWNGNRRPRVILSGYVSEWSYHELLAARRVNYLIVCWGLWSFFWILFCFASKTFCEG